MGANNNIIFRNLDLFNILRKTPSLNLNIIRNNNEYSIQVQADEKEG